MANLILEAIKKKGWSQGKLAQAAGLERVQLNRLIHRSKSPSVWTALKVAKALAMKVEELWKS